MEKLYTYEPSKMETVLTELIGNTLMRPYYLSFTRSLGIDSHDKVLDYCSGSGIISKMIARQLRYGRLVYVDVSNLWLMQASEKLVNYRWASAKVLDDFTGLISGGEYDKIIVHYVLHDFPVQFRPRILNQLAGNLNKSGILIIREPLGTEHGFELYRLINLIESANIFSYEYNVTSRPLIGKFIDVRCKLNNNKKLL